MQHEPTNIAMLAEPSTAIAIVMRLSISSSSRARAYILLISYFVRSPWVLTFREYSIPFVRITAIPCMRNTMCCDSVISLEVSKRTIAIDTINSIGHLNLRSVVKNVNTCFAWSVVLGTLARFKYWRVISIVSGLRCLSALSNAATTIATPNLYCCGT